jgi:tRNA G18 (ribose-2'-O)-methylase SpoU
MAFFEIGIYQSRTAENLGTLWRSAYQLGAAGIFTIGQRYSSQPSDPFKVPRHIPLRNYASFEQFLEQRPLGAILVGIETEGTPLSEFQHPAQAIYLLGSENDGLPEEILQKCNVVVSIESVLRKSYNVAVAGSIVMYHRMYGCSPKGETI